ncbi:MAG: hypothetical protein ACOXZW_02535 [Bacilli bacterium]|nr:hypothetical protein [Bacilli bacterium]
MIFRKPYAFLIKNFRLIHFMVAFLMSYVTFKTYHLLNFFNAYIQRGYFRHEGQLPSTYVPFHIFVLVIIITAIMTVIFLLMRVKNKPRLYYLVTIIFYLVMIIIFLISRSNLKEMQMAIIDPRKIRLTRDLVLIFSFVQYVILANALFTSTGFNIKKFDFEADLEELDITAKDEEEFEVVVGVDANVFRTKLRRQIRILKYALLENIIVISMCLGIGLFIMIISLVLRATLFNPVFSENQLVKTNKNYIKVVNSYKTDKNYRGTIITKDFNYVIIKLEVENILTDPAELNIENYHLVIKNQRYLPVLDKYHSFFDLGLGYTNQVLMPNNKYLYILVYEIDQIDFRGDMTLEALTSVVGNRVNYERVHLKPKDLKQVDMVGQYSLMEEMWLGQSLLGQTMLKINDYEIKDEFLVQYALCVMGECHDTIDVVKAGTLSKYSKTILKLDVDFDLDSKVNIPGINNCFDLIKSFGLIRYYQGDQVFTHSLDLINRTPTYYKGNSVFIEVLSNLEAASRIEIIFNVRNKQYIYQLKQKK